MLAWIHQATAGEREFLDSIFEVTGDGRMMGSVRVFEKDSEKEEEGYIRELLDSNLEKLCTPLRVSLERSENAPVINCHEGPSATDDQVSGG
jgi:hypothetical protein